MMKKSVCDVFLSHVPTISESGELNSTYVVNLLLNTFSSYTAVVLNIVTIYALSKALGFPKQLKKLLLSLALSDLGVGLIVQPFYSTFLVLWIQRENPGCVSYRAFFVLLSVFAISSFFGVFAITFDRFLAIHLHLRYKQIVTQKRVAFSIISLWSLSGFVAVLTFWYPHESSHIISVIGSVCLFMTTLMYVKIYLVFRRHRIQIQQTFQVQPTDLASGSANFGQLRKSAVGVFYVYLVFMACYLPRGCNLFIVVVTKQSTPLKGFSLFAWTVMLLNSSINPVIYCLKMKHIRLAVMEILRNVLRRRNSSPNCQTISGHAGRI